MPTINLGPCACCGGYCKCNCKDEVLACLNAGTLVAQGFIDGQFGNCGPFGDLNNSSVSDVVTMNSLGWPAGGDRNPCDSATGTLIKATLTFNPSFSVDFFMSCANDVPLTSSCSCGWRASLDTACVILGQSAGAGSCDPLNLPYGFSLVCGDDPIEKCSFGLGVVVSCGGGAMAMVTTSKTSTPLATIESSKTSSPSSKKPCGCLKKVRPVVQRKGFQHSATGALRHTLPF